MKRVQQRISIGLDAFTYYINNQWNFSDESLVYLRTLLNSTEKKNYKIDFKDFDLNKYLENGSRYLKINILKESDDELPKARKMISV